MRPLRLPRWHAVFAIKGQTLEEHWDYLDKSFMFDDGPNMILDDGGDATLYVLLGARAEAGEDIIPFPLRGRGRHQGADQEAHGGLPGWFTKVRDQIKGVSEETTTGVHRLYELQRDGRCPSPRSTSMTASPSRNSTTSMAARKASSTASAAPPTP
jgi:adenosylhomocysteinase